MIDTIRSWFTAENFAIAFVSIMLIVLFGALMLAILDPHTVYERIDECVALEVYTRAECVIIESGR